MKKSIKQCLAGILSVLMIVSLIPLTSYAATTETVSINKSGTYTLFNSGNTGSATQYSGSQGVDNNPAGNTLTNNNYDIYGQMPSRGALTLRVGCSFTVLSEITEQVRFTIYAYDVDEEDGEVDTVYLVDETTGTRKSIGKLKGMDDQWNTTVLSGISNTLFTVGHTYHLENTISNSSSTSYVWWVYIRSVSMDVVCGEVAEMEITDHSFTASINSAGTVSTSLYLKTNKSTTYNLEYTAVNNGNQRGSLLDKSINATSSGATASNSFSLLSGSDKGTYTVTVILKNPSNNNVVATYSATAGYSYSAVSYDPNGGSNNLPEDTTPYSSGNTVTVRFDNVPSKNGYTFIGWSTDKNATTPEYTATGTKTFTIGGSDVTLYAIYRENVTPVIPEPGDADIWDGSVASGFESGTGTESDPYIIKTAAQLAYLAQTTNAGNSYEGKFFRLANDIMLNPADVFARDDEGNITGAAEGKAPYQWTPIGIYISSSDKKPFSGSFDGNGFVIIGVYINSDSNNQGLFGYCKKISINDIGVVDGYISGESSIGGLIGNLDGNNNFSNITNCFNTCSVNGNTSVGGIVGYAYGTLGSTDISYCHNTRIVKGNKNVGGIVGNNQKASIVHCYNTGTIVASITESNVGGIVGYQYRHSASNNVEYCYNTGSISGKQNAGGIVGYNSVSDGGGSFSTIRVSNISISYNTGDVSGTKNVGGIVGCNCAQYYGKSVVENCYNTGEIIGTKNAGGVVGYNYSTGNDKSFVIVSKCYSVGFVNGKENVGGVVGYNFAEKATSSVKLEYCYYSINVATIGFSDDGLSNGTIATYCIEGLTNSQMENADYYIGFDFDPIWTLFGNPDYPYPELRAFAEMYSERPNCNVWDGTVATGFESGTGTESDPFIIKNASQLAYLAKSTNAGNSHCEEFFKLANDIILHTIDMFECDSDGTIIGMKDGITRFAWTPIGINNKNYFSGSFDGDGHRIIGIYINSVDLSDYQGLFGYCQNAKIHNLGVVDGFIKGNAFVGGLIGYNCVNQDISVVAVKNCFNTCTICGDNIVGGLIGGNRVSSGTILIEKCYNFGSIFGSGYGYIGGVVGESLSDSDSAISEIKGCYNTGFVKGNIYTGGILGLNEATVENCCNLGSVSGSSALGGVVGYNRSSGGIIECCNMGDVNGDKRGVVGTIAVGGIVGENNAMVKDCYNAGAVSGDDYYSGYVGGVVGKNYSRSSTATAKNCYNIGMVSGNGDYIGGVVGYNDALSDTATAALKNCYYLTDSAAVGYNNDTSGSGTITIDNVIALTDSQMRTQESFVGFDFGAVWTMDGKPDYPYPELQTVLMSGEVTPELHTHSYAETSRTEPTCTTRGTVVYTCSCGDSYTEVIPALGHTESDWIIDTPATCTENGTKHKECSVCRTILAVENIPALGHDFVDGECTRCHIHQYTITVNYVYADGTTVQPSVVKTLLEGEKYSITSPVISNYTADKAVVSGTAIQSLNITVTYREIEAQVIASIRRISLGNIDYNTPYSSLSLPETVLATTASGKSVSLKVFWNSTDYSPTTFGEQTINGTVIAAYGYKFGCEAKTTVTLTVTKNTIIRIPAMNLGRLPIGTTFDGLGVPSTAAVVTNSGSTHYLPVVWNIYSYDSSISGKHTIHGTLTLESGYALADGVANDVEISFELSETMYGTADIVFLIDTTGSMYDEIQNVKNNIKSFADMLEREGVSVRWALIEYRDITCDGVKSTKIIYSGSSEWYIDVNAYKDAISRLTVNGGGDREETVIDALKTATFLENRADAHSFYIVVTDADYKVNNQYGVTNMSEMISELKTNETITSVVTKTTYYKDYRSLTDGTGGILANIDGNFANELWKLSDLIVEDVVFGAVESIEIATAPNKTAYVSGDYFDGTGMTVRAIYTSGAEKIVTGYSVNPTRALSVSDTSIEINYRGKTATQTIIVAVTEYPVTGVRVSPASLEMKPGEKKSVTATISPSSATNKNVYWVTDNPNVATVKDGVVEAYEPGTANITVYTADGGYSAVVTVCVSAKEVVVKGIYLDTGSIDIFVGESKKVSATVYPADATDKTIIWTSENETIATVDADGNITAVSKGTTTITATASGYTAKVLVTVSKHDAATPQYSIDDVKGYVSKNVDIYIAIENNPGIISLRNYISYDTDVLELIKIEDIGLLNGYTEPAENISSPYILRWADALATQNNMKNGNIVKLTFKIKEETHEGKYQVSVAPIESRNFIGQKIVFSPATAFVEVLPPVCIGDLDGDGEISDWDSIIFNRYLAGWDVEIINDAADIDGDGEVSDWDAILLDRYLAGWDVTIG